MVQGHRFLKGDHCMIKENFKKEQHFQKGFKFSFQIMKLSFLLDNDVGFHLIIDGSDQKSLSKCLE